MSSARASILWQHLKKPVAPQQANCCCQNSMDAVFNAVAPILVDTLTAFPRMFPNANNWARIIGVATAWRKGTAKAAGVR